MGGISVAMDAGQSSIRTMVRVVSEWVAGPVFPGVLTDRPLLPQLAAVAAAVAQTTGRVDIVAAGVSGLTDEVAAEDFLDLLRPLGGSVAILAHDSISSYLGALGEHPGVVVAAGTGVVTLGVGRSEVARVDGWGYLMGDAGSGFWIGRAALDAVMRAYDGRGPATALSEPVRRDFPNLEAAYVELQSDPEKVSRIAAYAKLVAGLAGSDGVAATIIDGAARELAVSAVAALRRVGETVEPLVATVGQVFRGARLKASFTREVEGRLPGARVVEPKGTGLDGVTLMPDLDPDSALAHAVRRAE